MARAIVVHTYNLLSKGSPSWDYSIRHQGSSRWVIYTRDRYYNIPLYGSDYAMQVRPVGPSATTRDMRTFSCLNTGIPICLSRLIFPICRCLYPVAGCPCGIFPVLGTSSHKDSKLHTNCWDSTRYPYLCVAGPQFSRTTRLRLLKSTLYLI